MNEIFENIKSIIIDIADIPEDEIELDSEMLDDLCLSSIEIMSIIGDIEVKYDVKFASDDLLKIRSIRDLISIIEEKKN
ncbi:acyl carrier protein [Pseudobutyrivibrio xylanivorans]|uniref:Acyl carrier protein n=1 Tax=Pseudobutyrivibrio xylanivorans DSM 14809 TaxID=1123012 RepID=A0A1M6IJR6_PSEXY|nr:phosphopantetheine-binding protein [Pseudobutyrivibrio xylanivorans]SHJ34647.1 acyl carrier protein [Pseudobutyrivibrio xylanivorans DSM 14809]